MVRSMIAKAIILNILLLIIAIILVVLTFPIEEVVNTKVYKPNYHTPITNFGKVQERRIMKRDGMSLYEYGSIENAKAEGDK